MGVYCIYRLELSLSFYIRKSVAVTLQTAAVGERTAVPSMCCYCIGDSCVIGGFWGRLSGRQLFVEKESHLYLWRIKR